MSNTSIVYGYIATFMWRTDADWKLLWKLNREVVSGFIDAGEPAWLTGLFAVPHVDAWECTWQNQIIHFGGSYKDLSVRWDDWLVQFERLLSQLYWNEVRVHLREESLGNFTYQWTPTEAALLLLKEEPPVSVTSWVFEGQPRNFTETINSEE